MECPLIIFVSHAVEVILNSHGTQHFSASCLISHEGPLFSVLHVTLLHDNNFNLATLLPSVTNNVLHDCLMLIDNVLTPCNDLQEIPLGNVDFSWFTDGSCLKVTMTNIVLVMLL